MNKIKHFIFFSPTPALHYKECDDNVTLHEMYRHLKLRILSWQQLKTSNMFYFDFTNVYMNLICDKCDTPTRYRLPVLSYVCLVLVRNSVEDDLHITAQLSEGGRNIVFESWELQWEEMLQGHSYVFSWTSWYSHRPRWLRTLRSFHPQFLFVLHISWSAWERLSWSYILYLESGCRYTHGVHDVHDVHEKKMGILIRMSKTI